MEDVAQRVATTGFDMDAQFSEIGLRHGFLMDVLSSRVPFSPEYKSAWMELFQLVAATGKVEEVDEMEDKLIRVIRETVPAEDAFFLQALEVGELPMAWKEKALNVLLGRDVPVKAPAEPAETPSKLSQAHIEKTRRFATTRRRHEDKKKTILSTTRRH